MALVREVDSAEEYLHQVELSLSVLSIVELLLGFRHLREKTKVMIPEVADLLAETKEYSSYSRSKFLACSTAHL